MIVHDPVLPFFHSTFQGLNLMKRFLSLSVISTCIMLLSACASLQTGYEEPVVDVRSFRAVESGGVVPGFEIDLNVLNPNQTDLNLEGIYYTVTLEGHRVIAGVTNYLPVIPAYGEELVTLTASVDLLSSIQLMTSLLNQPRDSFEYGFSAKLDFKGWRRSIRVEKDGLISLSDSY